jgi:hypothetical protein
MTGSPGDASVRPEHRTWDPRQGKYNDIFRYPTKELVSVTAQNATSSEAA